MRYYQSTVGEERRLIVETADDTYDLTSADADVETILDAWREHAATLGRRVRIDTPGGVVEGEAVDVRFPGSLVVRTDDGDERAVHAGDCEHLRPA